MVAGTNQEFLVGHARERCQLEKGIDLRYR